MVLEQIQAAQVVREGRRPVASLGATAPVLLLILAEFGGSRHPDWSAGAEAQRLSLVVLSGDPDQGYFVDGSTQDMTTDLAWLPGGIVIARNSGFTYKDKTVDPKQAGSEPGLRCVLEGSVGRIRNEVRVNASVDRC